jgi:hypothetical protein
MLHTFRTEQRKTAFCASYETPRPVYARRVGGPRTGLDAVEKRKSLAPAGNRIAFLLSPNP